MWDRNDLFTWVLHPNLPGLLDVVRLAAIYQGDRSGKNRYVTTKHLGFKEQHGTTMARVSKRDFL
jgi:hypothetical protein